MTPAASSAIISTDTGAAGIAVRPAPPIVERGQAVAVREPVELELPRLDGVPEATDEQDVRSFPNLLGPDLEVPSIDWFAHLQPPRSFPESWHLGREQLGASARSPLPSPTPTVGPSSRASMMPLE